MSITFRFDGKKCLVTGATGGIGSAITLSLLESGATVYGTSTSIDKLNCLKQNIGTSSDDKFIGAICDLRCKNDLNLLVQRAIDAMSDIDIVVCNAGITKDSLSVRMKDEDWLSVIDVNLNANFIINREAGKWMMKRRKGRIINISSIVGCTGNFGQVNYAASKAGLIGLTKSIALELAGRNVTVNAIAPGYIETEMTAQLSQNIQEAVIGKIPMKKCGKPEDISSAVMFLASDCAKYITGTVLHVNGGMFMA